MRRAAHPAPRARERRGANFGTNLTSALPDCLPGLDELLDRPSRRNRVAFQPTSVIGGAIEIVEPGQAHRVELPLELGELFFREDGLVRLLHQGRVAYFAVCSPDRNTDIDLEI